MHIKDINIIFLVLRRTQPHANIDITSIAENSYNRVQRTDKNIVIHLLKYDRHNYTQTKISCVLMHKIETRSRFNRV
jgi:hypothetical protein